MDVEARAKELLDGLVYLHGRSDAAVGGSGGGGGDGEGAQGIAGAKRARDAATKGEEGGDDNPVRVCRVWSRDDLLRRLRTYSSVTWFCKPELNSAAACAARGWINVGVDTLECECCKARVKYPKATSQSPKAQQRVAEKFHAMLDTMHHKFCPWQGNACAVSLLAFPPTTAGALTDGFQARVEDLVGLKVVPELDPDFVDAASRDVADAARTKLARVLSRDSPIISGSDALRDILYKSALDTGDLTPSTYQGSLAVLSMCGWEVARAGGDRDRVQDVLACRMCGARVGVWNFEAQVERPLGLEYHSWNTGGAGTNTQTLDAAMSRALSVASAKAVGYTCLTSPLYMATPNMVDLCKTIAGGETPSSLSMTAAAGAGGGAGGEGKGAPLESEGPAGKRQKLDPIVSTKDPKLYRRRRMNPLKCHRGFCPWAKVSFVAGAEAKAKGAAPGWVQCLDALVEEDGGSLDGRDANATSVLSVLHKVQKVIPT